LVTEQIAKNGNNGPRVKQLTSFVPSLTDFNRVLVARFSFVHRESIEGGCERRNRLMAFLPRGRYYYDILKFIGHCPVSEFWIKRL
jgi:hypothetical protein